MTFCLNYAMQKVSIHIYVSFDSFVSICFGPWIALGFRKNSKKIRTKDYNYIILLFIIWRHK